MYFSKAFTLIELLIVVAIIAILAAIAVPNFLEAQTRSKVSRTKADMHSVAVALESYAVDTNQYPPGYGFNLQPGGYGIFALSTPIAYTTQGKMKDVFDRSPANSNAGFMLFDAFDAEGRILQTSASGPSNGTWVNTTNAKSAGWWLGSRGPDQRSGFYAAGTANEYEANMWDRLVIGGAQLATVNYDPTNGTVSVGNIMRVGGQVKSSVMSAIK